MHLVVIETRKDRVGRGGEPQRVPDHLSAGAGRRRAKPVNDVYPSPGGVPCSMSGDTTMDVTYQSFVTGLFLCGCDGLQGMPGGVGARLGVRVAGVLLDIYQVNDWMPFKRGSSTILYSGSSDDESI